MAQSTHIQMKRRNSTSPEHDETNPITNHGEQTDIQIKLFRKKYPLKYRNKDITLLENNLSKTYEDFNHSVEDTASNLHILSLNLKELNSTLDSTDATIARCRINPNNGKLISSSEQYHSVLHNTWLTHENKIQNLQSCLEKSINKSLSHVKRAHMKVVNIVSQHHLLLLPYFELKMYNRQLLERKNYDKRPKGITYKEALQELEDMLQKVHAVEYGVNKFIMNNYSTSRSTNNSLELSIDDYQDDFTSDYLYYSRDYS